MISKYRLPAKGVTFESGENRLHSFNDLYLMWNNPADGEELVSSPEIKTHTIEDIPGMDGNLDFTEKFGPIRYKNRQMTLRFTALHKSIEEFETDRARIYNALHGRYFKVFLDTDPEFYWIGRASVVTNSSNVVSDIVVLVNVFPYKMCIYTRQEDITVTSQKEFVLPNRNRMPVIMNVATDQALQVVYAGVTYEFDIGVTDADFELPEGDCSLLFKVIGSDAAHVNVSWREGSL